MFIDRDECRKNTHITQSTFVFRPQKLGFLFPLHQAFFDAIFHFNSTFALATNTKKTQQAF